MRENTADDVVHTLSAEGWVASEGAPIDVVRAGGRARFARPESDLRCTVGKRSVSFYHVRDGEAQGFRNYSTSVDLEYIRQAAMAANTESMPETPRDVASREAHQAQEESNAALRSENERSLQEKLLAGERVLASSGQRGQVFRRLRGLVVVLHADPDTEVAVCCHKRATYMAYPTIRGRCPVGPDEHAADCIGNPRQANE